MTVREIVDTYIAFFESRGHRQIPNAPLVPHDDPTTLFTSSGMQALVPYLLGKPHPEGKRLVNVQNCFRAQDIEEVGDNRHTTFFRMLGNWSLGDYFKKEQLPWFFAFLTQKLHLKPEKLFVSVFQGFNDIPKDEGSAKILEELFASVGIDPKGRIFYYGTSKNWWSRAGEPQDMPPDEPGGPDSEVFYDFQTPHNTQYGEHCHINCDCGRFLEIGNSVFMQYKKCDDGGFNELPKKNVDFGGGLERLLAAVEGKQDVFQTSLFAPVITTIEEQSTQEYGSNPEPMRIITDHLIATSFIVASGVKPSNKTQGYVLRRLIRRAVDQGERLGRPDLCAILKTIVEQYKETDPTLLDHYETILYTVVEEENRYRDMLHEAKTFIQKKYRRVGDEFKGVVEISADDAFTLYATHGLSPTQIKSLGYAFNDRDFANKMEAHQQISRKSRDKKFKSEP